MYGQGFNTGILKVRGAGLGVQTSKFKGIKENADAVSKQMETVAKNATNGVSSQQQPTNISDSSKRFGFL